MKASDLLKWVNTKIYLTTAEGLQVPCRVADARMKYGKLQLQISPYRDCDGTAWVIADRCSTAHLWRKKEEDRLQDERMDADNLQRSLKADPEEIF